MSRMKNYTSLWSGIQHGIEKGRPEKIASKYYGSKNREVARLEMFSVFLILLKLKCGKIKLSYLTLISMCLFL